MTDRARRWVSDRWPSAPVLACAIVAVVLVTVAVVDLKRTGDGLPEIAPICKAGDRACQKGRNATLRDRIDERRRLNGEYEDRSALYWLPLIAIALLATGIALARRPRQEWARVFTNLGIAGVWSGLAVTVLLLVLDSEPMDLPSGLAYAPVLTMLAVAAVGRGAVFLVGPRERGAEHAAGSADPRRRGRGRVRRLLDRATRVRDELRLDAWGHRTLRRARGGGDWARVAGAASLDRRASRVPVRVTRLHPRDRDELRIQLTNMLAP